MSFSFATQDLYIYIFEIAYSHAHMYLGCFNPPSSPYWPQRDHNVRSSSALLNESLNPH